MNRTLHRMGPHQAFFDEWGLEGFSWLFLAPPGSAWRDPTRTIQQKTNSHMVILNKQPSIIRLYLALVSFSRESRPALPLQGAQGQVAY